MNYTNEKAKGYKDNAQTGTEEKEIQITSPTGIITTNKIKELNVNTIGEEENKNVKIEEIENKLKLDVISFVLV